MVVATAAAAAATSKLRCLDAGKQHLFNGSLAKKKSTIRLGGQIYSYDLNDYEKVSYFILIIFKKNNQPRIHNSTAK